MGVFLKFLFILGVLFFSISSFSISKNPVLSSFWVPAKNDSTLRKIADQFEVTRKLGEGYEVLVPFSQTPTLLALAPEARLLEVDIHASLRNKTRQDLKGYHDFASVQSDLKNMITLYPQITSLEQYGSSLEKRPLWALKVTSSKNSGNKPAILLTASTHGDELITVEVVFGLLESLLSGYGKDPRFTSIVDHYQIYFVPVVNPDGYVRRERYANGIDPNRDYPWPEDSNHSSNPCVSAIMKFYETHAIKASIDFHAFGEMIMYPWAYTYQSLPTFENDFFDQVTGQMAKHNGYVFGQISKVIYVAKGSSADYYHWKHGSWALGIEVGTQKVPTSSQIPKIIQENSESTWTFVESIK